MIKYTTEEMKLLAKMSRPGSPAAVLLRQMQYIDSGYRNLLEGHGQHKEVYYLFEMPFEDLPLEIANPSLQGIVQFRLTIGK